MFAAEARNASLTSIDLSESSPQAVFNGRHSRDESQPATSRKVVGELSSSSLEPSSVSTAVQHRISIHVKVEENSASSTEESSTSVSTECGSAAATSLSASNGLPWSGSCLYRCNLTNDRRCGYTGCDVERCQEESHNSNIKRISHSESEPIVDNLLTSRDRFSGSSAFSTSLSLTGQISSYQNVTESSK